ncbi:hypothetical protein G4D82_08520 [Flavobacterium sp. CYK-4]|uniref:hypothetical protein n=1 Tax=Flavobacterium lotistagni TaxID=2709660 RepID=UPI001407DC4B|nr:hypothetical protein [Flavobacterium lotistagni]NHM07261.1 hypothetical protein [Flavobacterium lotistagni]
MKQFYAGLIGVLMFTLLVISCTMNEDDSYVDVSDASKQSTAVVAPVRFDLSAVPFPKLSDYHFFIGPLKNLKPNYKVLPYEPASVLFSDYAHKKRFVWMPRGTKATYNGDNKTLELPVGAVLIKNFYYDRVLPNNTTRIIETRLMIRKASGWIFAEYVWNAEQTEAYYDMEGSFTPISWMDENNLVKETNYRIPSEAQCAICHKRKELVNDVEVTTYIPIGIKPQNLNFNYNYGNTVRNQLNMWIQQGYLQNNFSLPTPENTIIDYNDSSKPLELRVRSYVDINCSHCHSEGRHCDYRPMRFAFSDTGLPNGAGRTNLGVCVNTEDMQGFPEDLGTIVNPGSTDRSMLYYRINTTNETFRMPLHGRTMIHQEGVALIGQWINSLQDCP